MMKIINPFIPSALTDIFEKADVSGNGKITLTDYVNMCVVYGIDVSEEEMLKIQVTIVDNFKANL